MVKYVLVAVGATAAIAGVAEVVGVIDIADFAEAACRKYICWPWNKDCGMCQV